MNWFAKFEKKFSKYAIKNGEQSERLLSLILLHALFVNGIIKCTI